MMFSSNQIKKCIENCKIAGDIERDSKEFISISQRVREGLRSGYDYNENKG